MAAQKNRSARLSSSTEASAAIACASAHSAYGARARTPTRINITVDRGRRQRARAHGRFREDGGGKEELRAREGGERESEREEGREREGEGWREGARMHACGLRRDPRAWTERKTSLEGRRRAEEEEEEERGRGEGGEGRKGGETGRARTSTASSTLCTRHRRLYAASSIFGQSLCGPHLASPWPFLSRRSSLVLPLSSFLSPFRSRPSSLVGRRSPMK